MISTVVNVPIVAVPLTDWEREIAEDLPAIYGQYGEFTVEDIVDWLGEHGSREAVKRSLTVLQKFGLVRMVRDGNHVRYVPVGVAHREPLLDKLKAWLEANKEADGVVRMPKAKMALSVGINPETVEYGLRRLVEMGFMEKLHRADGRMNWYRIKEAGGQ